jgi:hypothetical protein
VIFQYDANFVLYDTAGRPIWASNTSNGSPDRRWTVDINDSGVVYVGYHPLNPGGC